jgi:hypothetical protein
MFNPGNASFRKSNIRMGREMITSGSGRYGGESSI